MAKARIYVESSEVEAPPAFFEYAAVALTTESVQLMALPELGLFTKMRWYCWVNHSIPLDPGLMARSLGLHADEVREHLTERVLSFFEPAEDDPQRLICPALCRQMLKLMERRAKQAENARDSANKRRHNRNQALAERDAERDAKHHAPEINSTALNSNQLGKGADRSTASQAANNGGALVKDPFVRDLEAAEAKERANGS